jgi:hypothetical protein
VADADVVHNLAEPGFFGRTASGEGQGGDRDDAKLHGSSRVTWLDGWLLPLVSSSTCKRLAGAFSKSHDVVSMGCDDDYSQLGRLDTTCML